MNAPSNEDFNRLESKVDKLTDAVMRLVLLEERQTNQAERIGVIEQSIASTDRYVSKVDAKVERWINRGIGAWAVAAVIFTLVQFGSRFVK